MTPPSSIEEAAKRVLELHATNAASSDARWLTEFVTLEPQLAQAVLKMLPVIEAARTVQCRDAVSSVRPAIADWEEQMTRLRAALAALDTSSSLAAEGTTTDNGVTK
jgi:hypothetical protein